MPPPELSLFPNDQLQRVVVASSRTGLLLHRSGFAAASAAVDALARRAEQRRLMAVC